MMNFTCMCVTADGAVKFVHKAMDRPEMELTFAIMRPLEARWGEGHTVSAAISVRHRRYDLQGRHGDVLEYRERVD